MFTTIYYFSGLQCGEEAVPSVTQCMCYSPLTKLKDEITRIIINVEIHILFPNDLKFRRISQRRRKRTQSKTKVFITQEKKSNIGLKRDNSCFCVMTNNLSNVSSISSHVFLYGIPCIN